jgi:hypothetical protein
MIPAPRIFEALKRATQAGRDEVEIDGVRWIRGPRAWSKQFSWINDPHAAVTFATLGVKTPEA